MLLVSCGAADTTPAPAVGVDKPVESAVSATLGLPESPSGYYGVYTSSSVVLFGKLVRADNDWVTLADVLPSEAASTRRRSLLRISW